MPCPWRRGATTSCLRVPRDVWRLLLLAGAAVTAVVLGTVKEAVVACKRAPVRGSARRSCVLSLAGLQVPTLHSRSELRDHPSLRYRTARLYSLRSVDWHPLITFDHLLLERIGARNQVAPPGPSTPVGPGRPSPPRAAAARARGLPHPGHHRPHQGPGCGSHARGAIECIPLLQ